jgi:hypothetical protein
VTRVFVCAPADGPRVAQLCEKAGLYMRALQHYTDVSDFKRCCVNTHAIEPQALIEWFGTLSREWALECVKAGKGGLVAFIHSFIHIDPVKINLPCF